MILRIYTFATLSQVQNYAFSYSGTGICVVPDDFTAYRDHRRDPYASAGQTCVFWDGMASSDGRTVAVCNLLSCRTNHLDARHSSFVQVWRLSMSRFYSQYPWDFRTSSSR